MNPAGTLAAFLARIETRTVRVGIVGLGYVGLPLALLFAEQGIAVTGFDTDAAKVEALNAGRSYIHRIEPAHILAARQSGFRATADFSLANPLDAILICVPTPLHRDHTPDMRAITDTVAALAPHLHPGQLLVLESTTWPGTTEELVAAPLERGGLPILRAVAAENTSKTAAETALTGLMIAFSPEREDPGNTTTPRREIPKVLGGLEPSATAAAQALYGTIFTRTVPMSTPAAAEMTKLLENIYRSVNIALVNELKQLCLALGIDPWEVIAAASTKPFGFQAFQPGPGVGGHCIPVDPFYLTWKAAQQGFRTRFIELAGEVNESMPAYVVETTRRALAERGVALAGSEVLVLGVAYKRDVDDLRESPALEILRLLQQAGGPRADNHPGVPPVGRGRPPPAPHRPGAPPPPRARVAYNDPFFPHVGRGRHYDLNLTCTPVENLARFACVLIATDHSTYDFASIVDHSRLVIDSRNATGTPALRHRPNVVRC